MLRGSRGDGNRGCGSAAGNKIVWDFLSNVALSLILSFYDALAVAKTFSNC